MEVTDPQRSGFDPQHGEKVHLILFSITRILMQCQPLDLGFLGTRAHWIPLPFSLPPRTSLLPSVTFLSLSHLFGPVTPSPKLLRRCFSPPLFLQLRCSAATVADLPPLRRRRSRLTSPLSPRVSSISLPLSATLPRERTTVPLSPLS